MHQAIRRALVTRRPNMKLHHAVKLILGSGCHAGREEGREIKPTSVSLRNGSQVRVDMREGGYFSNTDRGYKNISHTATKQISFGCFLSSWFFFKGTFMGVGRRRQRRHRHKFIFKLTGFTLEQLQPFTKSLKIVDATHPGACHFHQRQCLVA